MSETRIMPKAKPRSTGIERTNTQVVRPKSSGGSASHVSASAGSGPSAQDQVHRARHPGAVAGNRQDAKVQVVDRSAQSGRPVVQVVDRSRSSSTTTPPGLKLDHAMLIGHLLDKYEEAARAIGDTTNAANARDALDVMRAYVQSLAAQPSVAPGAAVVASATSATVVQAPTVELLANAKPVGTKTSVSQTPDADVVASAPSGPTSIPTKVG